MCCMTSCIGALYCCTGSGGGGCSECVGTAACNPVLCSSCITGSLCGVVCTPVCTPTTGSGTDICTNTSTSCCAACIADLAYAGQDANGNDIYQNPDGSLRYADGSPATRADIAYNCGACACTPCSPHTCGTSCQPPEAGSTNKSSTGGPSGGGSGGGSAKPSGGASNPKCTQLSKLSQAMNKLGSTVASLFSGGKPVPTGQVIPGQKVQKANTAISPNSYLLLIIIGGALLLFLAFGHKPVPD
jgi:hypothetical protein